MAITPKNSRARRRVGVLAAAALSLAAFAAPGAAHAASCPGADTPISHSDDATLFQARDALVCLTNDARANAGLSQLTVDKTLSDFAFNKAYAFAGGANNVACGGVAEAGFKMSRCFEALVTWKPGPAATAQQMFDWMMTHDGSKTALMDPGVTHIGGGVYNGNHTDGINGDGATADMLMITPTDAGNNGGGGNPPANGDCAGADTPITQNTVNAAEDAITCLVNVERKKAGLAPLTVNAALHGAATAHSKDEVDRQFFSHTNPDGVAWCGRISAAGYPAQCTADNLCQYCRENIAYRGGAATPNEFMYDPEYGWMTHPEPNLHRETILDPQLKAIGVGVVIGTPDGQADGATATQDFGG